MARGFIGERKGARGATSHPSVRRPSKDQRPYTIDEALEIFIRAKEAENVRPRTIKDYRQHMSYLVRYLTEVRGEEEPLLINDLTSKIIREYVIYLKDDKIAYEGSEGRKDLRQGLSINTINMRLKTLKTLCRFLHNDGILADNPMSKIKPVRDDVKEEVPGLSDAEVDLIMASYDTRQFAEWRDKTLILLLLDTGLRINEAVSLTVDQIDVKRSEIFVPSEVAKNRKGRDVPVSRQVAKQLIELYEESRQYFGSNDEVFMNAYGEPFTASAFRRRLHRLKKKVGIPRLHPHMFRHTFCRNYILNGGDLFTLQKIVDHSDIKTTRKYIQMDTEHVRSQHNKYSPVRRLLKRD